jgi:acyl-coenzyme A synthetase/AMP-(fatty) acid ligase
VAALFHTGGTTGMPKLARHWHSGILYNAWLGASLLYDEESVLMCPLPLFHIFAVHPIWMSAVRAGSHVVFPTPQGYRGEGVFDNFWKLVERYRATFLITVPTAISALMQRPVDADVSSLRSAISGSAPLPVELYRRFETATGVAIAEGYGLTEATCLVSCNPVDGGVKKVGSVGFPLPYTDVRIIGDDGADRPLGETGEICVSNPGIAAGGTYSDPARNRDLYRDGKWLRTGDLGRMDEDGYLWITGRAKDIIIRGGHNIDPAEIEEALMAHEAVAFAGAIGQPDGHAGEVPCAYVELMEGATATAEELRDFARGRIHERAARPKHVEVLDELPKTAVGKVFKPDLRKRAIRRVYDEALSGAGLAARVADVTEDRHRGLVARLERTGEVDEAAVARVLGEHTRPWEWAEGHDLAAS